MLMCLKRRYDMGLSKNEEGEIRILQGQFSHLTAGRQADPVGDKQKRRTM